jgi:hypothetical protein
MLLYELNRPNSGKRAKVSGTFVQSFYSQLKVPDTFVALPNCYAMAIFVEIQKQIRRRQQILNETLV